MKIKKLPFKKIGIGLAVILVISQFFTINKVNPAVNTELDFNTVTSSPTEISELLKTSCYDCHSFEVIYPWYTSIAPFSWWIKDHINEGTRHLNFSIWGTYPSRRQDKKLKECVEMIEEGEMPMTSYTLIHGNAKLNSAQKDKLISWFNSLRNNESDKPK